MTSSTKNQAVPHDQTIQTYNQYAAIYDSEVIDFWENFPKEYVDEFITQMDGNKVLDLGSGSGRDALLLRERGADVMCVDASSTMTSITSKLGFHSICTTFVDFCYPSNHYDGVWAYTSLIHTPKRDARKIIEMIHKTLKSKGIFAIGVIEGDTAGMVERETMPGTTRYFKKYKQAELRELVEACGFKLTYSQDYRPRHTNYLNHIYIKI